MLILRKARNGGDPRTSTRTVYFGTAVPHDCGVSFTCLNEEVVVSWKWEEQPEFLRWKNNGHLRSVWLQIVSNRLS